MGRDPIELNRDPRSLLDANVLRNVGESLQFRHGLVREAVYDDLLPDQRTALHAQLAAILQARVDAAPELSLSMLSRLAFHWSAAHHLPRRLVASERAGRRALTLGTAEAVAQFERVVAMWAACRTRKPWSAVPQDRTRALAVPGLPRPG